jgi:hypothetical protein
MQVQAGHDRHVRTHQLAHALEQFAFAVVQVFRDHGAVQVQIDAIQRQRLRQPLQDHRADAFERILGDRTRGAGRRPGSRYQGVPSHGFDEARHRYVGARHRLEHGGPADQLGPAPAFLGKIFPRRARRRERIGLMLKAAYPDAHQDSPCRF